MKTQVILLLTLLVLSACGYKAQLLGSSTTQSSIDLSTKPTDTSMTVYSTKAWFQDATPSLTFFGPFEAQKIAVYKSADCSGSVWTEKTLSAPVTNYVDVQLSTLPAGTHRFSALIRLNETEQSQCIVMKEPYIYSPTSSIASLRQGSTAPFYMRPTETMGLNSAGGITIWGDLSESQGLMSVMSELTSGVTKLTSDFPGALKSDGKLVYWGNMSPDPDYVDISSGVLDFDGNSDDHMVIKDNGDVWAWGWTFGWETLVATNGKKVFSNGTSFAVIKNDGSVLTWGDPSTGGDSSAVAADLTSNVVNIYSKSDAFVAVKSDGSVVAWGDSSYGGDSTGVSSVTNKNVVSIFNNLYSFAALKSDGSVFAWGDATTGGSTAAVAGSLSSGVSTITPVNELGYAALKTNGSVITWGAAVIDIPGGMAAQLSSGVVKIVATKESIAALKSDGSVLSWGGAAYLSDWNIAQPQLTANVTDIVSTEEQFLALKSDGSVVGWGINGELFAGYPPATDLIGVTKILSNNVDTFTAIKSDGSTVTFESNYEPIESEPAADRLSSKPISAAVSNNAIAFVLENGSVQMKGYGGTYEDATTDATLKSKLSSGVKKIYGNKRAFVAVKEDGSAVVWGGGMAADITAVASQLTSGVDKVYYTERAFAVLKTDGSVVVWGEFGYGESPGGAAASLTSGVVKVASTQRAFAALKSNGSVIVWGDPSYGANTAGIAAQISSNVKDIVGNAQDFAVIKNDGTAFSWGGGFSNDSSGVAADLVNVTSIVANSSDFGSFAALRADGSVVAWGSDGGDITGFASELSSGVVSIVGWESGFAAMKSDSSLVIWDWNATVVNDVESVTSGGSDVAVKLKDGSMGSGQGFKYGEPYASFLGTGGIEALTSSTGLFFIRNDGALIGKVPAYRLEM